MQNSFYEKFGGAWYKNIGNLWFPRWHRKLTSFIKIKPNASILDVSCGIGNMLEIIGNKVPNAKLYGIDLSESMINFAKHCYPNYFFTIGNAEQLPFENGKFDIVTNSIAFHHYTNPDLFLTEAYRVLKPDGQFLLMDVSPSSNKKRKVFDFIAKYIIRDNHVGFKTANEIKEMLKQLGFKNISQNKIGFPKIIVTLAFK